MSRTWLPPDTPDDAEAPQVRLVLSHSTTLDTANDDFQTTPVDINGIAGVLATVRDVALQNYGEPPTAKARYLATVEWHPAPGDLLTISATGLPDTSATALRMARSVRRGGEVTAACPVEFTWLPAGTTLTNITVTGTTPADWSCDIQTSDTSDNPYPPELTVTTAPVRPDPGDIRVAIHGNIAYIRAPGVVKVVPETIMQLDGYGVRLRSGDPESANIDVLQHLTIQPTPADIDWLGRRDSVG